MGSSWSPVPLQIISPHYRILHLTTQPPPVFFPFFCQSSETVFAVPGLVHVLKKCVFSWETTKTTLCISTQSKLDRGFRQFAIFRVVSFPPSTSGARAPPPSRILRRVRQGLGGPRDAPAAPRPGRPSPHFPLAELLCVLSQ